MTDRAYIEHLQDKQQRLVLVGDAVAAALNTFLPDHALIRMWDEAKRYGEVESDAAR